MIDQDWDEQMVRESLRRSDEYRGPVVNRIIGRAYRDVLGREPDARGLEQCRNAVIRQGMTEDELRNDLRRSDEFRHRGAKHPEQDQEQQETLVGADEALHVPAPGSWRS